MKMRNSILLLIGLLIFTACGEQPYYEKVYSFEGKSWKQEVKPEYKVNITNIQEEYDFTLFLRTTTDYAYNNLWIFLKTETPDGTIERKPFEILIANPDGSWVGNKTGTVVETVLSFSSRKLPMKGEYKFTVEQGITESSVNDVLDLGFRVELAKKQK